MKTIITILMLLVSKGVMAQQQTIYGPDGRVTGRITTDSQGSKTIYDASGRVGGVSGFMGSTTDKCQAHDALPELDVAHGRDAQQADFLPIGNASVSRTV